MPRAFHGSRDPGARFRTRTARVCGVDAHARPGLGGLAVADACLCGRQCDEAPLGNYAGLGLRRLRASGRRWPAGGHLVAPSSRETERAAVRNASVTDVSRGHSLAGTTRPIAPAGAPSRSLTGGGQLALADDALFDLSGNPGCADLLELATELRWVRDRIAGHASEPMSRVEKRIGHLIVECKDRLAEGTGMRGYDDPDLRHLPGAVRPRLVMHHDDVVEKHHPVRTA